MIQNGLAAVAALLLLAPSLPAASGQRNPAAPVASHTASLLAFPEPQTAPAGRAPATSASSSPVTPTGASSAPAPEGAASAAPGAPGTAAAPAPNGDCVGANCVLQPQHIAIATPAPAPAPWTWQERVTWGAQIVLVVLGYVAILIALALLRKIERQTRTGAAAAEAAQALAQEALAHTQALVRAERPWLLVSVLPSPTVENGFLLMAANRGRGPARILSLVHEVAIAHDESKLPPNPEFRNQPTKPAEPRILLPGETTEILSFSRKDAKNVCENEEQFARVERWEEKIYLYGRVVYRDLAAHDDADPHETSWFCWYIHGRQKSGMAVAGLPSYNRHS